MGLGTILTNNEIKGIAKLIRSLENRETLLNGTTRKISYQEGGFLSFLTPLMTAGLPLIKSILTPLAKSVLAPLGLTAVTSCSYLKEKFWIRHNCTDNFKRRNG